MDIVEKKTWTVGDKTFDNYGQALGYQGELKKAEVAKTNASAEVSYSEKQASRILSRQKTYPCYIKVNDKYSTYIILVNDENDIFKTSLSLLDQRVKDGYWYLDEDEIIAKVISETQNGKAAFGFLDSRSDYEYETFELSDFDVL